MPAPASVIELIERFHENATSYRSGRYNETQVRVEFINPFFEALGWDMQNKRGLPQDQQDVIHEDAIKVRTTSKLEELPLFQLLDGNSRASQTESNVMIETNYAEAFLTSGGTKAPDYGFRIGSERKFFLEAKKPSVNIKGDTHPAFQLRRYGWSANLPLSILTDFEELAVYDCRVRPEKIDKASVARMMYLTYTEYVDKWDDITKLFSRDAVLNGSLDTYIETVTMRKGRATVDTAFLKEIEDWRATLAHNIAVWNKDLNQRELNYAVQMTIDRIIFLRICEDRGIEPYGRLQALYNRRQVYTILGDLFRQADDRYNSGLFHFKKEKNRSSSPDDWTLNLYIEDEPLKQIIKHLYYPDSPYEFSVLPIELLGQVYEQFLGKVIHLSSDRRAVVEEKPEVRKAGGVYYTPSYIVEYIVKNTVSRLLEGKTPKQVTKLRILDPSCGSGSFLIGAYQYLLDWHREYYLNDGTERHKKALYQASGGIWRLTTAERKRILLNNIYGVDIDTQAVEVTKLSLLLKVLEGETEQTLMPQLRLLQERALPDLGSNIKCGNTLIDPDFYDIQQLSLLDEEEEQRINVFDWESGFRPIMQEGGFDAVIGNPPWGGDIDKELDYYHIKYPASTKEHTDSFKLFIEACIKLVRQRGLVSLIVPNTLLRQRRLKDVRTLMLQQTIINLVDLGEDVFKGVVAPSCIFCVEKNSPIQNHQTILMNLSMLSNIRKAELLAKPDDTINLVEQEKFGNNSDLEFMLSNKDFSVPTIPLGDFAELQCKDAGINYQRINVGMQVKGNSDLANRLLYEGQQQNLEDRMYWKGSDIDYYWIADSTVRFCRPNYRDFIMPNEVVRLNKEVYESTPKILLRQTADRIIATIDYRGIWFGRSIIAIVPKQPSSYRIEYFLGLLNSRYFEWLYHRIVQEKGRVFAQVKLSKIKQLPIRVINFDDPNDTSLHNEMVELVEQRLTLQKQFAQSKTSYDRDRLQGQITRVNRRINHLVYRLYQLAAQEIEFIEAF